MSIGDFIARRLESLVAEGEAYERAKRQAIELLDRGLHFGGRHQTPRADLHDR